jgi:uncharacterized damage-inducible protein DinB
VTDLRYPVGKYERRDTLTPDERTSMIAEIAETPARMRKAIAGLTDSQLETPYREDGWTVRQVVHHVPDSHLNSYTRFKLALTEEHPTIRPYDEAKWAELSDSRDTPIETSLTLLESLHDRWTRLLRAMSADDYRRTLHHPDSGVMSLDTVLTLYAWHGRHHVAHITSLRERMGW